MNNQLTIEDIIGLPHYEPQHPRMPLASRAAQFAPFAALTGHNSAIAETARLTSQQLDMSTDEQEKVSMRIRQAAETRAIVTIIYFHPDDRKDGGRYLSVTDSIKEIDELEKNVILNGGQSIPIAFISGLKGKIFDDAE